MNFLKDKIPPEWRELLNAEFAEDYFAKLERSVEQAYASGKNIYPPADKIFRALELVPPSQVRVVIVGQDPYHGPGQANGLAFAVDQGTKLPPSLKNITKYSGSDGDLSKWAEQGVLLLNAALTVEENIPKSHAKLGWEKFTDAVIEVVSKRQNVVYLLWGKFAQQKARDIVSKYVLKTSHPSPLGVRKGFAEDEGLFKEVNEKLEGAKQKPIKW